MTCLSKMYLYQKNIWFTKCLEVWNLVYIYLDFSSVHPFQQVSVIAKISEYEIVNLTLHCFYRCEQTGHCISLLDWYRIVIIALHWVICLIVRLLARKINFWNSSIRNESNWNSTSDVIRKWKWVTIHIIINKF